MHFNEVIDSSLQGQKINDPTISELNEALIYRRQLPENSPIAVLAAH